MYRDHRYVTRVPFSRSPSIRIVTALQDSMHTSISSLSLNIIIQTSSSKYLEVFISLRKFIQPSNIGVHLQVLPSSLVSSFLPHQERESTRARPIAHGRWKSRRRGRSTTQLDIYSGLPPTFSIFLHLSSTSQSPFCYNHSSTLRIASSSHSHIVHDYLRHYHSHQYHIPLARIIVGPSLVVATNTREPHRRRPSYCSTTIQTST
jgi:hypothetical protein